jgi:hypothetical protein
LSYPRERAYVRSIQISLEPATAGVLEGEGVCEEVTERVDDRLGDGVGRVDGKGVIGIEEGGIVPEIFQSESYAPGSEAAALPPKE